MCRLDLFYDHLEKKIWMTGRSEGHGHTLEHAAHLTSPRDMRSQNHAACETDAVIEGKMERIGKEVSYRD